MTFSFSFCFTWGCCPPTRSCWWRCRGTSRQRRRVSANLVKTLVVGAKLCPLPAFSYLTLEREPGSNQCHVFFPTATFPSLHPTSRVDEISDKKVTFDKKTRHQWTSEWSLKTFLFSPIQFIYRQCCQPFCCYDRYISAHHRQRQSPTAAFKPAMPLLAASW